MIKISTQHLRRAWLGAALAVFLGFGCATDTGTLEADESRLRVEVQWRLDLASDRIGELGPRELGAPVMSPGGDLLVGATNGWVYRIEPGAAEFVWSTPVDGSVDARAALASNVVYAGTDSGQLVALRWQDGEELWRFDTRGAIDTTAAVGPELVYVLDSNNVFYALDRQSGELVWDYQRETPDYFTIKGGGQPLVVDNTVYAGFSDGHLAALDASSGDEMWTAYLGDESGEFGDIQEPIVVDEQSLLVSSHAGGIYRVERATGALLWRQEISEVTATEFASGWLFATTSAGKVLAIDSRSGDIAWEYDVPEDRAAMDLKLVSPFVAVATADGPLIWLRLEDGAAMAQWAPSTGFQNAPTFDEKFGYVMSNRGYLYGFSLAF